MLLSAAYAHSSYAAIEYAMGQELIVLITPSPADRIFPISETREFNVE